MSGWRLDVTFEGQPGLYVTPAGRPMMGRLDHLGRLWIRPANSRVRHTKSTSAVLGELWREAKEVGADIMAVLRDKTQTQEPAPGTWRPQGAVDWGDNNYKTPPEGAADFEAHIANLTRLRDEARARRGVDGPKGESSSKIQPSNRGPLAPGGAPQAREGEQSRSVHQLRSAPAAGSPPPQRSAPTASKAPMTGQTAFRYPMSAMTVTSPFGKRSRPYLGNNKWGSEEHKGIDLRADVGDDVFAAEGGKVLYVKKGNVLGTAGNWVGLLHPDGSETRYMHLSDVLVEPDQHISSGDLIARAGKSGTKEPHLHFEYWERGFQQDPEKLFPNLPRKAGVRESHYKG